MRFLRAAFCAALFAIFIPAFASANDITLTSRDGSIELRGKLVGYDGEYYRIETEYGVLTVDGSGVNCDGPGCPGLGAFVAKLSFSGPSLLTAKLLPALLQRFAMQNGYTFSRQNLSEEMALILLSEPGENGDKAAEITTYTSTNSQSIQGLIDGEISMSLTTREATQGEASAAQAAGIGNIAGIRQARVIALDALVPVVALGNPVRRLSLEQLAGIFSGKIDNWSEVGGENAPIGLYLPEKTTGLSDLFAQRMARHWEGAGLSGAARYLPTNAAVLLAVSRDPFGIAIGQFSQTALVNTITLSGECGFEMLASPQSIKSGDYPLTSPFYLYLPARRLPRIGRDFLTFLRSETAQLVIRETGLIDQLAEEVGVDEQGRRLANALLASGDGVGLPELKYMAGLMVDHTRLSTTFRFRDGSSQLDASSLSNARRLAGALEAGQYDGRYVRFIGFADGQGDAEVNQRLALKRAEGVLRAVREAAETLDENRVGLFAETLGEALPMACDDSVWGRQINRRVEVWLQDAGEPVDSL